MDYGRFFQRIRQRRAHAFATLQHQRRIDIAAAAVAYGNAQVARSQRRGQRTGRPSSQRQRLPARRQAAQVSVVARNVEALRRTTAGPAERIEGFRRCGWAGTNRTRGRSKAQCSDSLQQAAARMLEWQCGQGSI